MWTKEEIIEKLKNKYDAEDFSWASDFVCEDGTMFSGYKDDDEFYTDFDKFYPKAYAEELYEHSKAIEYITERNYEEEFIEYDKDNVFMALLNGFDYYQKQFVEDVRHFVFEDYDDFMDFYMEVENDENTGKD